MDQPSAREMQSIDCVRGVNLLSIDRSNGLQLLRPFGGPNLGSAAIISSPSPRAPSTLPSPRGTSKTAQLPSPCHLLLEHLGRAPGSSTWVEHLVEPLGRAPGSSNRFSPGGLLKMTNNLAKIGGWATSMVGLKWVPSFTQSERIRSLRS